ncbi:MAG: EthD family reductase [Gammaproteobacteria bacterium]|nr:MAG: EthD family reductase [Gammaproteobacteria bacterium]
MIKVSVMYPNKTDGHFNIEYYKTVHMQMINDTVGHILKGYEVDAAISKELCEVDSPYIAIGHLIFESLETFQKEYLPHRDTFKADLVNFTDITPIVQISEIK